MMIKKYHAAIASALLISATVYCVAQTNTPHPASSSSKTRPIVSMPEGFTDIQMGMALKDFLKIRTNVEHNYPFRRGQKIEEKGSYSLVSLDERAANPFFGNAAYTFEKGQLTNIRWITRYPESILQSKNKDYLPYVVRLYGAPSYLKIATDGSSKLKPELFWKKGKVLISASFTPEARFYRANSDAPRTDRGYVTLNISTGNLANLGQSSRFPVVTKADTDKYLVPVQNEIAALLPNHKVKVLIDTTPSQINRN